MQEDEAIVILTSTERVIVQSKQDVPLLRYLDTIEATFIPRSMSEVEWVVLFQQELLQWMNQPVTYGVKQKDEEIGKLLATRPPRPSLLQDILLSRKYGTKSKSRTIPYITLHRLSV